MTGYIAPVSAYLLLLLGLVCLPFPANCFSRHNPIHTIPSPTWRVKVTLDTGSYNGDMLLCFLAPASSVRRGGWVITYGGEVASSSVKNSAQLPTRRQSSARFVLPVPSRVNPETTVSQGGSTQSLFLPSRVSNAKSFQQRAVALKLNSKQHKQGRTGTRTQGTRSFTPVASSGWLNVSDKTLVSCCFFEH